MLFHFPSLKGQGWFIIKMFSEEKLSQAEQKKQSIGIKSFYSNTSYGFEYKKTA